VKIKEVNFFFKGSAYPIDDIAGMILKQAEEYLVNLFIQEYDLRNHAFYIDQFINIRQRECLYSAGDTVLGFHSGISHLLITTL
jgi:hypothetical protein